MWGISSAGRAFAWHAKGQRFDPAILHQKIKEARLVRAFLILASIVGFEVLNLVSEAQAVAKGHQRSCPQGEHQDGARYSIPLFSTKINKAALWVPFLFSSVRLWSG